MAETSGLFWTSKTSLFTYHSLIAHKYKNIFKFWNDSHIVRYFRRLRCPAVAEGAVNVGFFAVGFMTVGFSTVVMVAAMVGFSAVGFFTTVGFSAVGFLATVAEATVDYEANQKKVLGEIHYTCPDCFWLNKKMTFSATYTHVAYPSVATVP